MAKYNKYDKWNKWYRNKTTYYCCKFLDNDKELQCKLHDLNSTSYTTSESFIKIYDYLLSMFYKKRTKEGYKFSKLILKNYAQEFVDKYEFDLAEFIGH